MLKQVVLFTSLFVLSIVIILAFNDDVKGDQLLESTFHSSYDVESSIDLILNIEQFDNLNYEMNEEKIDELNQYRVQVVETSELTNTIEVHIVNLYEDIAQNNIINMDNNTLTITSDLGPLTIFRSPSFIPYAQFDEDYLVTIPFHMYIVYVPIGFSYSIN